MKKSMFKIIGFFSAALILVAFALPFNINPNPPQEKLADFPEDVQKILETSCYDCHSAAASNVKAKSKLNFSKWADYSDSKKVGKLESINETITEGDMPPRKYLEKYPDNGMDQEQKDIIGKWVVETSSKLMGE